MFTVDVKQQYNNNSKLVEAPPPQVIGDKAVTSSIRIAQVFPGLVGKKTRALWKVYGGILKYIINYAYNALNTMHIFI